MRWWALILHDVSQNIAAFRQFEESVGYRSERAYRNGSAMEMQKNRNGH